MIFLTTKSNFIALFIQNTKFSDCADDVAGNIEEHTDGKLENYTPIAAENPTDHSTSMETETVPDQRASTSMETEAAPDQKASTSMETETGPDQKNFLDDIFKMIKNYKENIKNLNDQKNKNVQDDLNDQKNKNVQNYLNNLENKNAQDCLDNLEKQNVQDYLDNLENENAIKCLWERNNLIKKFEEYLNSNPDALKNLIKNHFQQNSKISAKNSDADNTCNPKSERPSDICSMPKEIINEDYSAKYSERDSLMFLLYEEKLKNISVNFLDPTESSAAELNDCIDTIYQHSMQGNFGGHLALKSIFLFASQKLNDCLSNHSSYSNKIHAAFKMIELIKAGVFNPDSECPNGLFIQ